MGTNYVNVNTLYFLFVHISTVFLKIILMLIVSTDTEHAQQTLVAVQSSAHVIIIQTRQEHTRRWYVQHILTSL